MFTLPERPSFTKDIAINLAKKYYGIDIKAVKEFVGYDDRNYYLETTQGEEFVLKISNSKDSADTAQLQGQNTAMLLLKNRNVSCSFPLPSLNGELIVYEKTTHGPHAVRLLVFIKGPLLMDAAFSIELFYNLGQYLALIDDVLKDHPCTAFNSTAIWDLQHISQLQPYITAQYLGSTRVDLIKDVFQKYMKKVPPVLKHLEKQVIHNDVSDRNIILTDNNDSHHQFSIIDFGDMCYGHRVFEVAIVMSSVLLRQFIRSGGNSFGIDIGSLLRGYQSIYPLNQEELGILYWCIAGRFVQLLVFGSVKSFLEPSNAYLMEDGVHIWDLLPRYLALHDSEILREWLNS